MAKKYHRNDKNYRGYATDAFRFWAQRGCPTYDEAVSRVRERAIRRAAGVDPAKALVFADAEVEKASAGLDDIRACCEVFRKMKAAGNELVCAAVRTVYMAEPFKPVHRGDVSARVTRFALSVPVSESQVYHYLAQARELFAVERGLRVDDVGDW